MKTELSQTTLIDMLVVLRGIPKEEIEQIEAFSGGTFDSQDMALQLMTQGGPKWTIRVKDTKEPIVVAGLIQTGATIWRTWFMATKLAWDEYGHEVTEHTAKTRQSLLDEQEHVRIETVCLASREDARKWYETVGMEYEATLRGYGANGENAVLYVSLKGALED